MEEEVEYNMFSFKEKRVASDESEITV